jgi:hypothetical protein
MGRFANHLLKLLKLQRHGALPALVLARELCRLLEQSLGATSLGFGTQKGVARVAQANARSRPASLGSLERLLKVDALLRRLDESLFAAAWEERT